MAIACTALTLATSGPATPPTTIASPIGQLDADAWWARDTAARAAGVIIRLDQVKANQPTTVTLRRVNAAPAAIFAARAEQSGVPFQFWPP